MRTRLALLALVSGLAATSVRADTPLEPPDLSRYLRWGPVRVRPGIAVSNLGYDSNVFYSTGSNPKQGDYAITLSPKADGVVLFGSRAFLTFSEQIDYTVYKKYGSLSYFNQIGSARITLPLKRLGFYVEGTLNDVKERPLDVRDTRTSARTRRIGVGMIFKLGWRTDAEVGVERSALGYSDPDVALISSFLDRVESGTRLSVRYLAFGRTRLTIQATDRDVTFDEKTAGRDAKRVGILPGIEFGEGGRLTGSAHLGWSRLDSKNPSLPDFSGAVGDAKLSYRLGAGTILQLSGLRDVSFSIYDPLGFYVNTYLESRAIQYLSRSFGVEAGASRGTVAFPSPSTRRDVYTQYYAGVRLRLLENELGRRIEYTLSVQRWSVDSTLDNLDQSRTTLGFGAVIGY